MAESKFKAATAEKENQPAATSFHTTATNREEKALQKKANEKKPIFQTYIYRGYGGGYQGL